MQRDEKALRDDKIISHRDGDQKHVNHKRLYPLHKENTFKSNGYEVLRR